MPMKIKLVVFLIKKMIFNLLWGVKTDKSIITKFIFFKEANIKSKDKG